MSKRGKIIIFSAIVALGFFLRFWTVGEYPVGLNADEASYGYNAYSLIKTGKDEHGISWPVHLKSFADYKPAGTAYILIPFVKFFGLTVESIRFPSVFLGTLSIVFIFLLTRLLFANYVLSIISAFLLAISPWHIHFSRGAWETNIATFFMLLGTYFFFYGLKVPRFLIGAAFAYSISMYTYHTPRVVIPLFLALLFVIYRRELIRNLKWTILTIFLGAILVSPLVLSFLGPAGSARFSGVSVFSDSGPFWKVNEFRGEHNDYRSVSAKLLHLGPVVYGMEFMKNYLSHFDGNFLFISGDRTLRSGASGMGEMYLFDIIFFPLGIYFLLKNRPKGWQLPLFWLVLAPIPASLTFQSPNALRSHNMIIPLIIISAFGFYNLILVFKEKATGILRLLGYFFVGALVVWNISYYLHQYYIHYSQTYPEAWEYGIEDLVTYLESIKNDYSKIYVTEQYDQPYIIFLFYLKYPPEKFQKEVVLTPRDKFYFSTVRDFGNFHFENIVWDDFKELHSVLVCGTDKEIPEGANIIKRIYFPNGKPAFECAEI